MLMGSAATNTQYLPQKVKTPWRHTKISESIFTVVTDWGRCWGGRGAMLTWCYWTVYISYLLILQKTTLQIKEYVESFRQEDCSFQERKMATSHADLTTFNYKTALHNGKVKVNWIIQRRIHKRPMITTTSTCNIMLTLSIVVFRNTFMRWFMLTKVNLHFQYLQSSLRIWIPLLFHCLYRLAKLKVNKLHLVYIKAMCTLPHQRERKCCFRDRKNEKD